MLRRIFRRDEPYGSVVEQRRCMATVSVRDVAVGSGAGEQVGSVNRPLYWLLRGFFDRIGRIMANRVMGGW